MNKQNRVFLVPGIKTNPFGHLNWHNSMEPLLERAGWKVSAHAYRQKAIRNPVKQKRIAQSLAIRTKTSAIYENALPHVVCHSNGAAIACRALREHGMKIDTLICIMPAAWEHFGRNGINEALALGNVQRVVCYCSKSDFVVRYGGAATRLFNVIGLGYGTWSYSGARGIAPEVAEQVSTTWFNDWGHSDFQKPENLQAFVKDHVLPDLSRAVKPAL